MIFRSMTVDISTQEFTKNVLKRLNQYVKKVKTQSRMRKILQMGTINVIEFLLEYFKHANDIA